MCGRDARTEKQPRFTAIIRVNLRYPAPPVKNWEDYVGAKFYCLHALADGNQRIRIRCLIVLAQNAGRPRLHVCLSVSPSVCLSVSVLIKLGLPPFHFPNPDGGLGAKPPADGARGYHPWKTLEFYL